MRISDWSLDVCSSDLGISVPPFWLIILLIILFAVTLGWLPAGGMGDGRDFWADLRYLVLPVAALTIATEIGRSHVCTPVTNAHLVCRLLLATKTHTTTIYLSPLLPIQ